MNGFSKVFASICLKAYVSKLQRLLVKSTPPSQVRLSYLILENNVLMHQCAISAKDINPKAASPDLLLSSAFVEQRPLVPVGEENNLLNNTLWNLFF